MSGFEGKEEETKFKMNNLAGFMFGNVNENGELENDILDPNEKQHLGGLCQLGLGSMFSEIISQENEKPKQEIDGKQPLLQNGNVELEDEKNEDLVTKSPNAMDFSDINELAEDSTDAQLQIDREPDKTQVKESGGGYEADDEEINCVINGGKIIPCSRPEPISAEEAEALRKRKLETPLAAMLPQKYADVHVTQLFPDFRPNKVLRFSRLFGPGKTSSLPQVWRGARKRRKKRKFVDKKKFESGSDSEQAKTTFEGWQMIYGPDPMLEDCCQDDMEKLMLVLKNDEKKIQCGDSLEFENMGPKVTDWRFGPAQIWYDILKISESGDGFNYGFKLADQKSEKLVSDDLNDDAFLMVSQVHWEDDVIWNGEDMKHKSKQKIQSKNNAAGWTPSSDNRTVQIFNQPGKSIQNIPMATNARLGTCHMASTMQKNKITIRGPGNDNQDDIWYSIFPVENEELIYGIWEDEIIWDPEKMNKIPKPKILTLDPNDENIILGIPDDIDPALLHKTNGPQHKVKIPHPHVKKSKLLLGKAGVINVLEEDTPPPPSLPASALKDPFNISNDIYYLPKSSETTLRLKVGGGNLIQHSTPVVELRTPFVPTYIGAIRLRNFHRPPLKRFSHGVLCQAIPHGVLPLGKHIKKKSKQREQERIASGGGDVFFMRTPDDLSGRDGELVLVEFSEEHPPLINQVGMCSKIKNYYKRTVGKEQRPPVYKFGETTYAHTSPFLGILMPGQSIQALENNMYRAPIYLQKLPETDFLIIRTRQQYFIRDIGTIFVAGQECPLYEVPGPNSKRANNFVRDFLQVFIYRLFWKSTDIPRRIKMDDIKKGFPTHSESSIRKRLKLCADFKRTGMDSNWWVIKPEFRLPTEEEIRAMVSPEQCCSYFSMIAAEQRLKDAGYGEKFLFTPQDDDDEDIQLKMDDEIKVAPWNTTRAYIQAMKGKCLLQLNGPADPTGCGEGFSYVRVPNKPTISKEELEAQPKRIVTGTDADLRRLSLSNAKALLKKFGVPDEDIKKLSRWEVIDVVRTLSTEKAKAGEEGMTKFSRGNRFSIAEHQERYKEECQRIFDLQNRVLASHEVLSTDEGESSDEDSSDIEEMGKNIENMLANKKTSTQVSLEREEQERQELRKMMMNENSADDDRKFKEKKDESQMSNSSSHTGRVLKIHRTFRDAEGKEYTRVEIVRKSAVIDTYLKIRNSKDEAFIKQFAVLDEQQKEEMKREKRRIQEQLRRIRRNQEKERMAGGLVSNTNNSPFTPTHIFDQSQMSPPLKTQSSATPVTLKTELISPTSFPFLAQQKTPSGDASLSRRKRAKLKPDLKLKCGACGKVGHMRTNKACPLYQSEFNSPSSMNMLAIEEQDDEPIERIERNIIIPEDDELVNIDGTKVKLSSKLIKQHAEEAKRRTLLLKVSKEVVSFGKKRKRMVGENQCDYLRHQKTTNRRRTDPVVVLSTILENILNDLRCLPDVQPFLFPVNTRLVPDYNKIITKPMDLQTIRDNLRQKKYQNREEFLADINQIVINSNLYNGSQNPLTLAAQRMLQCCVERLGEKEDRLMRLEKAINPLLDDNDQVALTFILENVVTKLKSMNESWPFLKPVNKKLIKDYYSKIKHPMDLETMSKKVSVHKYHNRQEFIKDIQQIYNNCITYNGQSSPYTTKAEALLKVCKEMLQEYDEHLSQLEENIRKTQEIAYAQADIDPLWMGEENYTIVEREYKEGPISPENTFDKVVEDEFNFIDVEGEVEANLNKPTAVKINRDVLEEDLLCSSEDEFDEVPLCEGNSEMDHVELTEMKPAEIPIDDDSQQVAETLVHMGNFGLYAVEEQPIINQAEESIEVDPNYDPSDFLMAGLPSRNDEDQINNDLAISDSDEEQIDMKIGTQIAPPESETTGELWF